ncbi:MAG TPA: GspE/PulE family protein [Thermoanaerobaculia bacterium]|nr:GspE/PulE family protein [Thermoanaerobaculia bacterium]
MLQSIPGGRTTLRESGGSTDSGARRELSLLDGLRAIPSRVARSHQVIPLRYEGERLIAGARDPRSQRTLDTLRRLGHRDVAVEPLSAQRYQEVMEKWYGPTGAVAEYVAGLSPTSPAEPGLKAGESIEATPAPRFLELTLQAALAEGASDVHVEPDPRSPRVRFRVDGILVDRVSPPAWLVGRVIGRIKALAGLALGECLFAQDGVFDFPTAKGSVSVRVSILPCLRGEAVVLRLLTGEDDIPSLAALGVPEDLSRKLVSFASAPEGLIVFAGPTGSGKTTTLHALLHTVDASRRNVISIEEPVEIRSRRLRQVPVRRESGLDFAGALRYVLRQDPDVILVGETRDTETAQLVVQAALAGHLVFTTVHASSALAAFDRFTQLGADRALLAQVTRLTVSQRLLRRICPHCQGAACFACEGTGLKGRTGLYEVAAMHPRLAGLVRQGAAQSELRQAAREHGFRSLLELARDLVRRGVTTEGEVARVLDVEALEALDAGGAG